MKKIFTLAPAVLFVLALLLVSTQAKAQSPSTPIQDFFKSYFEETLKDEPEYATNVGRHEYDDRWSDLSKAGRELRLAHMRSRLAELAKYRLADLSEQDQLSARLLKYDLTSQIEASDLSIHLLRVGQLYGFHNRVYLTMDRMPARTPRDYQNILARLHAVPAYIDQNLAILDEAIQEGWTQPQIVVDTVNKQIAAQLAQEKKDSPLLAPFRNFPSNFPADQQTKLRQEAEASYDKEFLPAWRKLQTYMTNTYAPKARKTDGIGGVPGGKEAYAILVRRLTTTNATPEEIHKTGEAELQRLEAEMLATARETGFAGTLQEFEKKLDAMPEQHFRSKEEMLIYCRNAAKIIEPELPNLFRHIPLMLYGIRAIPPDREAASASNAQAPAPDGSVPGWFNLNTYEPEKQVRYDKQSLVLHEAVPGHVFQGSIARSLSNLPEFRKFYGNSAYAEGWALYAESLGGQLGLYKDPYDRFGRLASERFRAVRLVVDTGIHSMGWTREQAIAFFKEHAPQVSLAEVDRYISWPAQALAYKMGQLRIMELRKQAEQKLGPKFDIREFHDVVLRDGALPLELLQEQGQKYINAN
jgi:prolyl oligopeptidase